MVLRRPLRAARPPQRSRHGRSPHPHTGLQTVSWLFSGEVEHRDSAGVHAMVRPGELNLMTAGAGICHSEVSTPRPPSCTARSCGWRCPTPTATPTATSRTSPRSPQSLGGATLRVFLGELADARSPVHTFTPLLGAQLDLDPGADLTLDVDRSLRARRAARSRAASRSQEPRSMSPTSRSKPRAATS